MNQVDVAGTSEMSSWNSSRSEVQANLRMGVVGVSVYSHWMITSKRARPVAAGAGRLLSRMDTSASYHRSEA